MLERPRGVLQPTLVLVHAGGAHRVGELGADAVLDVVVVAGGRGRGGRGALRAAPTVDGPVRLELDVVFEDPVVRGDPPLLRERLQGRLARPGLQFRHFSDAEISEVYAAYADMLAKWKQLPVGGKMELNW